MVLNDERARQDLIDVVMRCRTWHALAMFDIRSKYRLSTLGSWWITMTTGALALTIGVMYGQFFGQDVRGYLPYFVASFVTWSYIAVVLGEASQTLVSAGHLVKSASIPIVFHVMRMVHRNLIIFAHNAVILAAVWLFVRWSVGPEGFLSLLGIALLYLFLAGLSVIISVVCVRYRDVPPLIQVVIQFLFFVTPVIWIPEQLQFGQLLLALNPISYLLVLVRDPILGRPVAPATWAVAVVLTAMSIAAAALIYARYRNRIAYWV